MKRNMYAAMNTNSKSIVLVISLIFALPASISAAPGDLDLTFSGDGKLLDFMSRADDFGRGVAIQPDGKIVVAGWSSADFAVARYNTDGSLDTSFGTDGKVTTDINSSYDEPRAIAIQADGKIVLAGQTQNDFALVRYNSDGSLDTSFGANGKMTTDFNSGYDAANSVAIQTDGKIVAVGVAVIAGGRGAFAAARYNTDGSLDTTFDSDGKVTTEFTSSSGLANSVAIQDDGKIVAAGFNNETLRVDFTLVRYNVDGSLDTSFDGDGKVTTKVGSTGSEAYSVAIQSDGRIVAAGYAFSGFGLVRYSSNGSPENVVTTNTNFAAQSVAIQTDGKIVAVGGSNNQFAVVRLHGNFSIDTTFGTNGRVTTPIGSYASALQVAVQTDGKIVAAGFSSDSGLDYDFGVVRYNANGSLDTSFDSDGKVTTDFGFFQGNALLDTAIQPDGRIVAVGEARGDFAVLRYNPDGSPDTTFGSGTGKVRTAMRSYDGAHAVAIQTDGKVVAAGGSLDGDGNGCGFALARYNSDGSLDTTFGAGGRVDTGCYYGPPGYRNSFGALDIAIQPDGKIVAASGGDWSDSQNIGFLLIRFNPNGSLDTTFDGDGIVITEMGSNAIATSVAIQSDGKIVAAGRNSVDSYYSVSTFTLARYNPDGSLDTTFDGDGKVTTVIGTSSAVASVAIQSDGKIVAAGWTYTFGSNTAIAVVRYNPNGSLDATFNSDGIVTTAIGPGSDTASSVAIDRNGKLVVAGSSGGDFALARYNPNGSLDTTFGGGDGISTVDFGTSYDQANGMALDSQGRAVVVGVSSNMFAIARFLGGQIPTSCPNPIDCPDFFVRQHYRDFLNREPDSAGLAFWKNEIDFCGSDAQCVEVKRINVSAAYFLSIEFQQSGYLVYRFYKSAFGNLPGAPVPVRLSDFLPDAQAIGQGVIVNQGNWQQQLETNKQNYANAFVQRTAFTSSYPTSMSPGTFVDTLFANAGVIPSSSERASAVAEFGSVSNTADVAARARALRLIAENATLQQQEFNRAFVLTQYFGYLRRNPNDAPDTDFSGYNFWLTKLNQFNGDFNAAEMVKAFLTSTEYRQRFGP